MLLQKPGAHRYAPDFLLLVNARQGKCGLGLRYLP